MVQKMIRQIIDDIDDSPAIVTRRFALDGVSYEIDLSEAHSRRLDEIFAPYVASGRRKRADRTAQPRNARSDTAWRRENAAIRAWAAERGIVVGDRGRIPVRVREAYYADTNPDNPNRPEALRETARQLLEKDPTRRALAEDVIRNAEHYRRHT